MVIQMLMVLCHMATFNHYGAICPLTGICSTKFSSLKRFSDYRAHYLAYLSPKGYISKKKMATFLECRYQLSSHCCRALLSLVTETVICFDTFCHLMGRFKVRILVQPFLYLLIKLLSKRHLTNYLEHIHDMLIYAMFNPLCWCIFLNGNQPRQYSDF